MPECSKGRTDWRYFYLKKKPSGSFIRDALYIRRANNADQNTGDLPVKEILERENIFVMDEKRAMHQDIRPIHILILNLMPLKEETELQLLRSLSNTPLQVDVTFMAVGAMSQEYISQPSEQVL